MIRHSPSAPFPALVPLAAGCAKDAPAASIGGTCRPRSLAERQSVPFELAATGTVGAAPDG